MASLPKYETFPTTDDSNWLLISMHDVKGIRGFLSCFPQLKYEQTPSGTTSSNKGCSATLLWSGKAGNNVPVQTFDERSIGFVMDPAHLLVPQADLFAYRSGGKIAQEIFKVGAKEFNGYNDNILTSKYPAKKGYLRYGLGQTRFTTNLAKNVHVPGTKTSIYHDEGSARIFAENIWRKYFKPKAYAPKVMKLNDPTPLQKADVNPIAGLLLTRTPTRELADTLLSILNEHSTLSCISMIEMRVNTSCVF